MSLFVKAKSLKGFYRVTFRVPGANIGTPCSILSSMEILTPCPARSIVRFPFGKFNVPAGVPASCVPIR